MCKGRAVSGPSTATHSGLLCFPFKLSHQQSCTSNEFQDLVRGDVETVTRFHKVLTQVTQSLMSQSLTFTQDVRGCLILLSTPPTGGAITQSQLKEVTSQVAVSCQ
jgi:hypothetical protein